MLLIVVDDFGVKYVGKEHAQHLIDTLKKWYKLAEDWEGKIYCGINLDWHYMTSIWIPPFLLIFQKY
jgi:hypothetical protein